MPRIPRKNQIEKNLTYHVFNRGNGKLEVFHDDSDFLYFLKIVKRYKQKYNLDIFHWSLMGNHFHFNLSIDIPEQLSKCIGAIQQAYAQYHHKRWDSAGKLWQGRFKSQAVQKEGYLYECGRYIERNPMRAGLILYPWDYRWSSCSVYTKNQSDDITTIDPMYKSFGETDAARAEGYKKWLMEGVDLRFDNMDIPVGDKDFVSRLLRKSGRVVGGRKGRPGKRD